MIQAVIFDMDGLLLDTEPLYRTAWQQASEACGRVLSDRAYARLLGRNRADAERMLAEEFGEGFAMEHFRTVCEQFEADEFAKGPVPKKDGVDELITLLESRHIPKAVATSTDRARALPNLAASGLLERFDAVATGDEVANGKPAPDLFLLAAQRLGVVNSGCLVIEDAEPGVRAARSAGMSVYIVPDMITPSPEASKLANAIFHSLHEVARHLELEWKSVGPVA
jgi:HAD superfamily hydrolase (TIGR01509 family)